MMEYFHDIQFVAGGHTPDTRTHLDYRFEGTYHVQFVRAGSLYFGIDGGPRTRLDAGVVFWHDPSHSYQYGNIPGEPWDHSYVVFRGIRGRLILENGFARLSRDGWLALTDPDAVAEIFDELLARIARTDRADHARAVILLESLLALLEEQAAIQAVEPPQADALADLCRRIVAQPAAALHVAAEAEKLGVSEGHFRRLFRRYAGTGPYEYHLRCRMFAAARRLQDPAVQVKQVAREAGYDDPCQFSKMFRAKIGLSPQAFRRQMPPGESSA